MSQMNPFHTPHCFKDHFNITLTATSRSFKEFLSVRFFYLKSFFFFEIDSET
jgi:hypothetical protein